MCGINGFNFKHEELIREMNSLTKHRGPDDTGFYLDDKVSLGNNRLSIIDLSERGHQPMSTADGRYTIVFNGEIYNFKELKKDLEAQGVKFNSTSDTEVVLNLYALYGGTKMLKAIRGIFAMAIYDKNTKEIFLARDPFGVKPFYYFYDGKKFIFSSEAKAIFAHDVPRTLNIDALNTYLRFLYVLGPETMWNEIKKLPPAHFAICKNNGLKIQKYWSLEIVHKNLTKRETELEIKQLLTDSVKEQLVSDRPVGLFLSGGLDSSIILSIMSKFHSGKVKTFSVGFDSSMEQEKYNQDLNLAKKSAAFFGADHTEIILRGQDVCDNFEKCIYHMDEPVSNHIQVATYILSKKAKEKLAVALGGDGGDELFGGYDRYYYNFFIERFNFLPLSIKKSATKLLERLSNKSLADKFLAQSNFERFWAFMSQKEVLMKDVLSPQINSGNAVKDKYRNIFREELKDGTNQMMWVDAQSWLVDESLIRSDKLTMANSLEQRVPFLDPRLVSLAMSIPSKQKLDKSWRGKKILRNAFAADLPDYILQGKKRGFFSPASKWVRGEMRNMVYEILSPGYSSATKNLFNFEAIKQIVDDHMSFKKYGLNTIWSLMTFQVWHKIFIDHKKNHG